MTVRWITRRIAQAESKWRKKGKFRGHSHVDAVACVGGWRAEPNVAPGVGQCQGGEQTGAPAALRPLQAHQSQEEPEFHPVVRAAGKQHTTQLPNQFVILVFLCPFRSIALFSPILSIFSFFFFRLICSAFHFLLPSPPSLFFLSLFSVVRIYNSIYNSSFRSCLIGWWFVVIRSSSRSSFPRVYAFLRFSFFFFFFFLKSRVESRFTAGFGYVTLSVYKGKIRKFFGLSGGGKMLRSSSFKREILYRKVGEFWIRVCLS